MDGSGTGSFHFKAGYQLRAVYVVIIDQNTVTQAEPSAGAREPSKATKKGIVLRSAREPFIYRQLTATNGARHASYFRPLSAGVTLTLSSLIHYG